ncbi:MAG TPA: phosphotransferase [Propionibacteriaceae bacterium]|nr:phosphotransferase [Propionibacteriaceae bacterium]
MSGTGDPQVADQVLRYISNARWFAGKGRRVRLRSLTPLPWLTETSEFFAPAAPPAVRFEIAEVSYPAAEDPEPSPAIPEPTQDEFDSRDFAPVGAPEMAPEIAASPTEYYQLAVSYRPAPHSELHHAEISRFTDPDLGPVIGYDATQDPEACRAILRALLAGRRLRATDSEIIFNTTAVLGLSSTLEPRPFTGQQSNTSVMLGDTAILKLFRRLELGPNLDIEVHAALNAAGISDVAGLFGWIQGSWVSDGRQLDADLGMVVEMLAGAIDGWDLALDSLQAENTAAAVRTGSGFTAEAEALGNALAETHHALRAAFPTTKVLGTRTAVIMMDRLGEAAEIAPALAPHIPGLLRCFDHLGAEMLDTQRVHGDFHLGQTLHTPAGWKIIDFEGEPAKTMAERRALDAIWRDIAGMLRSFDYASASVPGPRSAAWAKECRAAFLRGYTGGQLSAAETSMLRAYEADKAIYEVVYETRNRPDWVSIPLRAVAALASDNRDSVLPGEAASPPTAHGEPASRPIAYGGLASPPQEQGQLTSPTREQE